MIWAYVEFSFRLDIRVQYNWCRATWFARQSRDQRSRGRRCWGVAPPAGGLERKPFPQKVFLKFCLKMACYGTQWSRDFEDNMPAIEAPNRFEPGEWAKMIISFETGVFWWILSSTSFHKKTTQLVMFGGISKFARPGGAPYCRPIWRSCTWGTPMCRHLSSHLAT